MQGYVANADVTIFTGKESNARKVLSKTKKDSLFLFNGWGCNPIVVAPDAHLDLAVEKTVEAKTFNSGQDCAGPDDILVHKDIAEKFLTRLELAIAKVKVGSYTDPEVTVGRIADEEGLVHIASLLYKHGEEITLGGTLDFAKSIVYPTVIVSSLSKTTNYQEFFSPVFFVNIYDEDSQLSTYFEDPRYAANGMYVSLFGSSPYVDTLQRSIVYREKTILDVESGNSAYGGFSYGASFVATQGKIEARPILIPLEIFKFLEKRPEDKAKFSAGKCKQIFKRTSKLMNDIFGSNLVFGFVSGSVAKFQATGKSDIDNMAVLHKIDAVQKENYIRALQSLSEEMGMSFDEEYPTEIVTLEQINHVFSNIDKYIIDVEGKHFNQESYDAEIWANFLGGKKGGITGDRQLLLTFEKEAGKIGKGWKEGLLQELAEIGKKDPNSPLLANLNLEALRRMDIGGLMKTMEPSWLRHLK